MWLQCDANHRTCTITEGVREEVESLSAPADHCTVTDRGAITEGLQPDGHLLHAALVPEKRGQTRPYGERD